MDIKTKLFPVESELCKASVSEDLKKPDPPKGIAYANLMEHTLEMEIAVEYPSKGSGVA